jgi:hypothetical protein
VHWRRYIYLEREREKRQKERYRGWRHATEKTERKRQRGRKKVGDRGEEKVKARIESRNLCNSLGRGSVSHQV